MNYCTKCQSYYQVAGTCNCFALKGVGFQVQPQPYVWPPAPTAVPWPIPGNPISPTIIWGNTANTVGPLIPPVINNTAAAACAAPFTGIVRSIVV